MDLPLDVKTQLMQMAGITDVEEFDKMAAKVAAASSSSTTSAASKSTRDMKSAEKKKKPHSPFQGNFYLVRYYVTSHLKIDKLFHFLVEK